MLFELWSGRVKNKSANIATVHLKQQNSSDILLPANSGSASSDSTTLMFNTDIAQAWVCNIPGKQEGACASIEAVQLTPEVTLTAPAPVRADRGEVSCSNSKRIKAAPTSRFSFTGNVPPKCSR